MFFNFIVIPGMRRTFVGNVHLGKNVGKNHLFELSPSTIKLSPSACFVTFGRRFVTFEPRIRTMNRSSLVPAAFRDYRTARDWQRPWRDPPGFLLPNCPCCNTAPEMYSLGGQNSTPAVVGTADKTDTIAETTVAVATASLSQARWELAAVGNPATAGYFAGGRTAPTSSADQTTTDKLTYSTDTTSFAATAALSLARSQLAGLSERTSKGYFGGGLSGSSGVKLATTDKISFAGDSMSALGSANLSQARSSPAGMSEGTSKGYWAGGVSSGSITATKVADKITFASDTTAALTTANLSLARFRVQAGSDGSTKGYWAGGQTGGPLSATDKITFSTDTTSSIAASCNQDSAASGSDGNSVFGLGGRQGAGGIKITFATDTSAILGSSANLSMSRTFLAGVTTVGL
jgi:hypothetical protein